MSAENCLVSGSCSSVFGGTETKRARWVLMFRKRVTGQALRFFGELGFTLTPSPFVARAFGWRRRGWVGRAWTGLAQSAVWAGRGLGLGWFDLRYCEV